MAITDTRQLLEAAEAAHVSPLPGFAEADKLLDFMWWKQLSTVSPMSDEYGPFGTRVIVNKELLTNVAELLEAAYRHHRAQDEANAAMHFAEVTERPLTKKLAEAARSLREAAGENAR